MNRATFLSTIAVATRGSGVPVLMYHAVNDTKPANPIALGLTLPTTLFEAHLRYLQSRRIPTLTTVELVDALRNGRSPGGVVLTFDDGYADAANVVVPLLVRYGARATFFINSGTIGTRNHVSWAQLRDMRKAGMEIGAHGAHHLDLTTLDRKGQLREAGRCADVIARYAGVRPVSYAYASGEYNATTLDVMREIGMRSAWTERYGTVHDLRRPFEMPRLRVTRETGSAGFAALVG